MALQDCLGSCLSTAGRFLLEGAWAPPGKRGWLSEYPARAGFGPSSRHSRLRTPIHRRVRKADRATFFRTLPVASAALLLPFALAACGSSTQYSVTMTEFAFEPGKFGLKRGEKAIITLENKGSVEHNFVIPQLNFSSPNVAPGQTAKIELSIPRGPLKVVCTIPGHEEAGMVGEITLEARR